MSIKTFIDTELEVAALGIVGILILEIIALFKGVDGVMFGAAIGGIGIVVGWVFKGYTVKRKKL